MSLSDLELSRQGGRFNADLGMLLTTADIVKMGEMQVQTLLHFLMVLFYDEATGLPMEGFPRSSLTDANSEATSTGALTFTVNEGWGLSYNNAVLGGDEFSSAAYQMVVTGVATAGTLGAHDPTNPRIDLIALKPARVADQSATRNIKDPSTGALSTSSVNLRNRFSAEIVVVAGTPGATPVAPALPAGHLLLARAEVPATAGAANLVDSRKILHAGSYLSGPPGAPQYLKDHVHPAGGATELNVAETAPTAMAVNVTRGRAVIDGAIRYYPSSTLTIATADGSNPRIDVISAKRNGALAVTTGTPAASPAVPSTPVNAVKLAEILVGTGVTTIVTGNVTDKRKRSWMSGDGIRKGSLSHEALTTKPWRVGATGSSNPTAEVERIEYEIVYPDGTEWDGAYPLKALVEVYYVDPTLTLFAAAGYDNTNGANQYMDTLHMATHLPVNFLIFPYQNCSNQGAVAAGATGITGAAKTGRMLLTITAQTFSVELCRLVGSGTVGEFFVSIRPIGPDGAPLGTTHLQTVTFV